MAKTLVEEPQGSEEETPSEAVTFHVSVLALCCLVMALLFSVKSPWYVRGLFSLFLFLLCSTQSNPHHLSSMNNYSEQTHHNIHNNYFFFP